MIPKPAGKDSVNGLAFQGPFPSTQGSVKVP